MVSLTKNEARTLEFLVRNFFVDYNINQLAKELDISPGGMFKILKKLGTQKFVTEKRMGNSIFYKINYASAEARDAAVFALTEKRASPYASVWIKDLGILKNKTDAALLFGSVLKKGRDARDIDLLLVFPKGNLKDVEKTIDKINKIKPKKIHAVYQTKSDLFKNLKKRDKAILEEIRTGIILWGREVFVDAIREAEKNGAD